MRHRWLALAAASCVAFLGIFAASASAANTLGPPPWTGALCPAIGLDTGCQYGIDVTEVDGTGAATKQTIAEDGDQGAYDGDEDAMVVIKNDSTAPLNSLHMGISGSGQQLFAFDNDGLCSGAGPTVTWTPPAGCPFGTTGYEGPTTSFANIDTFEDSGTVGFSPALAPGATTYFSLETFPNIVPTAGTDNNWPTSQISAPGQTPNAYMAVQVGTNVTDQATINGRHGAVNGAVFGDGSAGGTVIYTLYANDRSCSTTPVYTSQPEPVLAGIAAPSDPVGAALPKGRYYWLETYSGDGGPPTHNTPSQSVCGQEILAIGASAVNTKLSASVVTPGTPVSDTATLSATVPKAITGTFSFAIYTDKACKVPYAQTPGSFSGVTPTGNTANSGPVVLPSGTYYFVASYSGDTKNAAGSSICGSEVVHAANSAFTIVKKPKVGKKYQITFTVAITDPGKFSWTFTTPNKHGLFKSGDVATDRKSKKHCGKGKIKVAGKCVPAIVKYGTGSKGITPALATITVKASGKARSVLSGGHTLKLTGLLTFQSSFGGPPTSQAIHVTVHGKAPCTPKRKKHHQCKK